MSAPRSKHFAANNQESDASASMPSSTSARCVRSYLPAFERAVNGQSRGRSCAPTTSSNGTYCSEHHAALEILRGVGLRRLVVSDWGAVHTVTAPKAARPGDARPGSRTARRRSTRAGTLDRLCSTRLFAISSRSFSVVQRRGPAAPLIATKRTTSRRQKLRREGMVLLKNDGICRCVASITLPSSSRFLPSAALPGRRRFGTSTRTQVDSPFGVTDGAGRRCRGDLPARAIPPTTVFQQSLIDERWAAAAQGCGRGLLLHCLPSHHLLRARLTVRHRPDGAAESR